MNVTPNTPNGPRYEPSAERHAVAARLDVRFSADPAISVSDVRLGSYDGYASMTDAVTAARQIIGGPNDRGQSVLSVLVYGPVNQPFHLHEALAVAGGIGNADVMPGAYSPGQSRERSIRFTDADVRALVTPDRVVANTGGRQPL